jgi:hypothetical protein
VEGRGSHLGVSKWRIINELMKTPFPAGKVLYLTRLETRMDPVDMTQDIRFILDSIPNEFRVEIHD